jgi:hypothetical protein
VLPDEAGADDAADEPAVAGAELAVEADGEADDDGVPLLDVLLLEHAVTARPATATQAKIPLTRLTLRIDNLLRM